jgi:hypothetical protein
MGSEVVAAQVVRTIALDAMGEELRRRAPEVGVLE